jgi:siroheme synthase
LALLSHTLQAQQLKSPSVIVVGDVVQGARAWLTQTSETQKVRHSA